MNATNNNIEIESLSISVQQLQFLQEISVQQDYEKRHITDILILEVIQKLRNQVSLGYGVIDSCIHHTDFRDQFAPRNTSIGNTIRMLRKFQQLTQKQVAESIGVTAGAVTQWELGATEPSWKYILPLANVLKCDPLWLLTGNPQENQK